MTEYLKATPSDGPTFLDSSKTLCQPNHAFAIVMWVAQQNLSTTVPWISLKSLQAH